MTEWDPTALPKGLTPDGIIVDGRVFTYPPQGGESWRDVGPRNRVPMCEHVRLPDAPLLKRTPTADSDTILGDRGRALVAKLVPRYLT